MTTANTLQVLFDRSFARLTETIKSRGLQAPEVKAALAEARRHGLMLAQFKAQAAVPDANGETKMAALRAARKAPLAFVRKADACPLCGGHMTSFPNGQVETPYAPIWPTRGVDDITRKTHDAPFRSCDRCEYCERT